MTAEPMVKGLFRTSPLGDYSDRFARSAAQISEEPFRAMAVVRTADGDGWPAVNSARLGTRTTIWLGPDEWLVTDSTTPPERLVTDLEQTGAVVTDVSAQRTTIRLRGPLARDLLAKGCSVDLHPRSAPVGTAVQTAVARCGVILVVLANDPAALDVRLLVRSTFAGYLADWLLDAAVEFVP